MPWMSSHLPHTGHELLQLGYCMHLFKHHKVSPETSIRHSRLWKEGRCFQSSLSKPHLQMLCWKEWCNRGIDSTFNKPAKQVLQKWHCPINPFQHTSTRCKRNNLQDAPNRCYWCVMHQQSLLNRLDNQWCKKVLWFSIENGHDHHCPVMDSRKSCIQKCRQKRKMVYVLTSFVTAPYMYEHPDGASVFQGYLAVACSPAQIAAPSPVFIPHFSNHKYTKTRSQILYI